jgi:ribosomal protein S12 methylthiotransferase
VDSQVMLGLLEKERFTLAQDPRDAQVIIVNTCSFIDAAKEESIETILEMGAYKDEGTCKVLVVSGCLAQRYSKKLEKEMPEVDLFIGTGQYHRVTELLSNLDQARQLGGDLPNRSYIDQPAFIHTEKTPRMQTGASYSAYLKISEGCNRRCSFCIIPTLRGFVRSRSVESLVQEATSLSQKGVRELNLVAQDLTHYGIEQRYVFSLVTLLQSLAKVEGIDWIRLHYVYPDEFSDALVDLVAREPKIVKYLDMPIQHTNDRILSLMRRKLTKARLFDLVQSLRSRVPGIVFRTSMIVGFPGETEEEFEELCEDLTRLDLDHVGVFSFSKEEGTHAATLKGAVHPATKRRRRRKLIELLQSLAIKRQERLIGERRVVLLEGVSEETDLLLQGRLETQAQGIDGRVLIQDLEGIDAKTLQPGALLEVELKEVVGADYVGVGLRLLSPPRLAS